MYKTWNIGTGSGMRRTWEMGKNVAKHTRECPQTFPGISPTIPGMSSNIPGNVLKHSG